MSTIAFIGLGTMGRPMAANLTRAGFDVVGFTRTAASRARALDAGVPVVDTLAEALSGATTVITVLPDSPDVDELVRGVGGLLDGGHTPELVIDMSTIRPDTARSIAGELASRSIAALDAPVSGGEKGAIDGTLSIMVGGDPANVDRARPLFEAMGSTITHAGPAGAGQVVKAANQLLVAGHIQLLAESLRFLQAEGADLDAAYSAIGGGLAGSTVITRKAASMSAGEFAPGFRAELHHKDLGIVAETAAAHGLRLPLTELTATLMADLVAAGHGGLDHSALALRLADPTEGPR